MNRIAYRSVLLAGIAGTALLAQPAFAQDSVQEVIEETDAAEAMAQQDGEIVVTARRRVERLQDVPISLTAYSGDQLEREGAIDITDIADTTPNVTLEVSRGTNSTLTAFIRGVGQQDPVAGFEQGVGIYLDDVYLNRPQGAVLDIYDVERIEVLRGPQGTLYGRNTIGGAVKYVTRRLPTDTSFSAKGVVGTYGQTDLVAKASTPLGDLVRVGVGAARLHRNGFGENLTTGQENYDKDIFAVRASLEAGGGVDEPFFRLSGDYTEDNSNPRGGHRLIPGLASGAPVLDNVFDTRGGLVDPEQQVTAKGVSAYLEWPLGEMLTFKSISAWRADDSATPIDFDTLPAVDLDVPALYANEQFSQEFQLGFSSSRLNGVLGAYFLDADAETVFDVRLFTLFNGLTALTQGEVETNSWALFGDFTYDLTDRISVSLGGRYTNDQRNSRVFRETYLGGGSPIFGGAGIVFATTSDFEGSRTDKDFTPRASISFKPNDDHHLYASYAEGFKGGGFDPRGQTTATPDFNNDGSVTPDEVYDFLAFDPETVKSYEIGWKGSLGDRVNASLALFNADYEDVQIPGSVGVTDVNGNQNFIGITTNAAKARIRGLEFEGVARLLGTASPSRLDFGWSLGLLDAEYLRYIDNRGIDVSDSRKVQNTPEVTASGSLTYGTPMGGGYLTANTTVSYRGDSQQFELASPLDQEGFALVDAGLTWELPGDHWTIGAYAKNLFDKEYIVAGYNFLAQDPDSGELVMVGGRPVPTLGTEGTLTAYYGNPRQLFLSVGYRF
ncbi:TonB-dependent receptor [Sphingomicrobium lutaoense]|uniref:Iron complex outermembrane receptor protein n=1 Tax=Sphingomicrobium lutaoense TaxID=515949 RepID=A0A839Z5F7_9SPHN|nr:TonB-dependent receptor [Sphingomicrobium lutaoense]MBB3764852.1 iron complex outermembrane receptor protein [Sphingomicrobium lutaoense]